MTSEIPEEFDKWWDSDWQADCPKPNIRKNSPLWWAYQGWMAGAKAEREMCARVCDGDGVRQMNGDECAAAIRARDEE